MELFWTSSNGAVSDNPLLSRPSNPQKHKRELSKPRKLLGPKDVQRRPHRCECRQLALIDATCREYESLGCCEISNRKACEAGHLLQRATAPQELPFLIC